MYFNGQHDKFGRPVIYMKPVRDTSNDRVIKVCTIIDCPGKPHNAG
jgi:hypothetical protein